MKRILLSTMALATCTAAYAANTVPSATSSPGQIVLHAGSQNSVPGPGEYFTGSVKVDPLTSANPDINVSTAYVTFEPGARSAWHTHPKGQYLIVTSGVGLTQEWGKAAQEIRPGDVVWCPPGVKHWHGATAASSLTHIAVTGADAGKSVTWMETVSDAQYSAR